jgi:predicted phage terminase large subunit-like protein
MSRAALREALADLGEYGFAGQFMQNPVPRGGGMFKPDRVVAIPAIPDTDFVKVVRYWDKAGTKGAGTHTVGGLMGMDKHGRPWILDITREQLDAAEREALMKRTAQTDRLRFGNRIVIYIEQEPGSGGKDSALNSVKNLIGFAVRLERPVGDKTARADPLASQMNAGLVFRPQVASWWDKLEKELKFFPHSRFKDQVDAISAAFNVLNAFKRTAGKFGSK